MRQIVSSLYIVELTVFQLHFAKFVTTCRVKCIAQCELGEKKKVILNVWEKNESLCLNNIQ